MKDCTRIASAEENLIVCSTHATEVAVRPSGGGSKKRLKTGYLSILKSAAFGKIKTSSLKFLESLAGQYRLPYFAHTDRYCPCWFCMSLSKVFDNVDIFHQVLITVTHLPGFCQLVERDAAQIPRVQISFCGWC